MTCFMSFYHQSGRISNNQSNWRIFYWVSPNTDVRFNRLKIYWSTNRRRQLNSFWRFKLTSHRTWNFYAYKKEITQSEVLHKLCNITQGLLNDIFLDLRFVNQIQKIQDIKMASLAHLNTINIWAIFQNKIPWLIESPSDTLRPVKF